MVDSSPSWWLTELGVERSANLAIADSGTMVVAPVDSAEPLDGSRAAVRLVAPAGVPPPLEAVEEPAPAPTVPAAAAVPVLAPVTLLLDVPLPPVLALPAPAEAAAALAGTYTSFSDSGDCAYFCATPMITWYWFSSS